MSSCVIVTARLCAWEGFAPSTNSSAAAKAAVTNTTIVMRLSLKSESATISPLTYFTNSVGVCALRYNTQTIHPSAWKGNSRKFTSSIMHSPGPSVANILRRGGRPAEVRHVPDNKGVGCRGVDNLALDALPTVPLWEANRG